jgi:Flp pilus assembly protein TadD
MKPTLHSCNDPAHAGALFAACSAIAAALLLSGCGWNHPQSAFEVVQQQREQALLQQQREDEATQHDKPTQAKVALSIIKESQLQGRYFAALAYIDAYRKQFGDSPELGPLRADALRMTGQTAEATQAYKALLDTPQAGQGWRGLGLIAGSSGAYADAAQDLAKAARLDPTNASLLSDLGFARMREGDLAGARVPLGQAAELEPTNTKVLANLSLLLLLDGDASGAGKVMERAQLEPEARNRVYQLAAEIHSQAAAKANPTVARVDSDTRTSVVRNVNKPAPQGGGTMQQSDMAIQTQSISPVLESLMDRFSSPSSAQ